MCVSSRCFVTLQTRCISPRRYYFLIWSVEEEENEGGRGWLVCVCVVGEMRIRACVSESFCRRVSFLSLALPQTRKVFKLINRFYLI